MALWRGRVSPATLLMRGRLIVEYGLDVAIKRRRGEIVLAGTRLSIANFVDDLQKLNPNLLRLPVTIPSHSHYLAAAADSFREILSRQMHTTIRWDACMDALAEFGVDTVIELGPGHDLAKLIEAEHPQIRARAVDDFADYRKLTDWLR